MRLQDLEESWTATVTNGGKSYATHGPTVRLESQGHSMVFLLNVSNHAPSAL